MRVCERRRGQLYMPDVEGGGDGTVGAKLVLNRLARGGGGGGESVV